MKELCCKILAAIFILLIIASLIGMRRDILRYTDYTHGPYPVVADGTIHAFDSVLVGAEKRIGIVEEVTNHLYHVVCRDKWQNTVHGIYTKEQLQKVIIVSPHTH